MRKFVSILTCIFLFQVSKAQDTIRHFEFGSTLITANLFNNYYNVSDRPSVEFINGLFFRYTKKRIGLRIHASYSDNTTTTTSNIVGWPYGEVGSNFNNKNILIGAGVQFSILKHRDWFYTFLDLSYRNIYSTGYYSAPLSEKFTSTSNGFDCFFGLGFKLRVFKNVYLSPEIGYYSSSQFVNRTTTLTDVFSLSGQPFKFHDFYSETNINPVFKLHLTVKF